MPLRNHFVPPIAPRHRWESFHASWPTKIVEHLIELVPPEYVVEPRVRLGVQCEIDIGTWDSERTIEWTRPGVATLAVPKPTFIVDQDLGEEDEFSVQISQADEHHEGGKRLIAAIELVSPANKDRPVSRRALVSKCASLLRQNVCVSVIDLVVTKHFNLYADVLDFFGMAYPGHANATPSYAATCRNRKQYDRKGLETWIFPLDIGNRLPALPIWLGADRAIVLDLERSYEETCRLLRLP